MPSDDNKPLRVAVVGPCAAGKSTLVSHLRQTGYEARHVAQEHSYVADMWQRLTQPDVLIYLDIDYEKILARRPRFDFKPKDLVEQHRRLAHARKQCDLYLNTSSLTPAEVQEKAQTFLSQSAVNQ